MLNVTNITDHFASTNKANTETIMNLANTALAGVERFAALNLNTARAAMEGSVESGKSLLGVKDVQSFIALQASQAQPAAEKAIDYARSVYEIFTQTQGEVAKMFESQVSEATKFFNGAFDKAAKSAPAGTEGMFTAVKSAMASANSAYAGITKAARQVSDITEANLTAATDATVKAVGSATAKTRKAA